MFLFSTQSPTKLLGITLENAGFPPNISDYLDPQQWPWRGLDIALGLNPKPYTLFDLTITVMKHYGQEHVGEERAY